MGPERQVLPLAKQLAITEQCGRLVSQPLSGRRTLRPIESESKQVGKFEVVELVGLWCAIC